MSVFNRSKRKRIETSVHNLSHNFAGTFYPGYLYPVLCTKVVPGDTFQIASFPFLRSQPFVSPLMSNVFCDIRYFYCRNLLLWENFDKYITNAEKYGVGYIQPGYVPVHPYLNFHGDEFPSVDPYLYKAFFDNLYGAVDIAEDGLYFDKLDALPARMYNLIYNEYYMNENYSKPSVVYHGDYSDSEGNEANVFSHYKLLKGCYRKDYFTSMLPSPQRGPAVSIEAAVDGRLNKLVDSAGNPLQYGQTEDNFYLAGYQNGDGQGNTTLFASKDPATNVGTPGYIDYEGLNIQIDINDIRKASAIQRFLEASAVNGNRYAEFMLAHFGVRTPDNSSFRPQYLGGGSKVINYSPVEQNSQTDNTPQGTLAGKGVMSGLMGMNHRYFFTEYGWIMAIMVIRPQAYYAGGVNRQMWCDQDRFENYYFPGLQNIGMQSVKRRELTVTTEADDNMVDLGYQDRYMEYKNIPSSVHGELLNSMRSWVAIRDFTYPNVGDVGIGQDFMEVQPDVFDENAAVSRFPPFIVDIRHDILARRPMQYHAKYGGAV